MDDVVNSGQLALQPCNVFKGEPLIYLFYGKPSFRPNISAEPLSLSHYFPVCFIFKPDIIDQATRIYPFDSGAFAEGLYAPYLHKHMQLEDFELDAAPSTPGQLISYFYGSTSDYMASRPGPFVEDASQFEANSYYAMINAKESNQIDSRMTSIEIQNSKPISIKDYLMGTILPAAFRDSLLGKRLQQANVDIIPYRTADRMRPSEYTSEISSLCVRYLIAKKFIEEDAI